MNSYDLDRGYFTRVQWADLFQALRPDSTRAERKFYFDLLDRDGNQRIDIFDFLDLREILQLRMTPVPPKVERQTDKRWEKLSESE